MMSTHILGYFSFWIYSLAHFSLRNGPGILLLLNVKMGLAPRKIEKRESRDR